MLDRRDSGDESLRGIILLNLYSDDGLASIDNSALWDKFMLDFKAVFDVVEKDPDYFLGCAIEWDPETGVIQTLIGQRVLTPGVVMVATLSCYRAVASRTGARPTSPSCSLQQLQSTTKRARDVAS